MAALAASSYLDYDVIRDQMRWRGEAVPRDVGEQVHRMLREGASRASVETFLHTRMWAMEQRHQADAMASFGGVQAHANAAIASCAGSITHGSIVVGSITAKARYANTTLPVSNPVTTRKELLCLL